MHAIIIKMMKAVLVRKIVESVAVKFKQCVNKTK